MHNQKQLGNDIFFTNPAASIEVNVKKYCSVAAKITIFKANKGKKSNSSVFKRRVTKKLKTKCVAVKIQHFS
jgi:hypothetical protein